MVAELAPKILVIIQMYMSTLKTDEDKVKKMYEGNDELMKHHKTHDHIIIISDLNAIVGESRESIKDRDFSLEMPKNARGEWIVEICRGNELFMTNTKFENSIIRV